jgi:hypothetical protein
MGRMPGRVVLTGVCCVAMSGTAWADDGAGVAAPSSDDQPESAPPPTADSPVALTAPPPTLAQDHPTERSAKNSIYAEGLGAGIFYSLNYDRTFGDFSGRVGFGYVSLRTLASSDGTSTVTEHASLIAVPLTVSYLGIGSKKHMFELGAGATILNVGANASAFDVNASSSSSGSTTVVFGNAILGYRLQPPDGGFLLRAGLNVILGGSELPVLPWPYLALGGTF